ncbi:hypothetical protein TVAG_251630 [Trichomonas vaginalis G3]|uniref:Uncharacterized protein n=1 Tax=Trichomonas vaginalis (strain ATCC PRA-98 / G3) TaxID=412133 RepID=A2EF21_TRIV3|nr:multidrug resistance protein YPNP-related family [Trichomonas vaginalis G3]EAY08737.1 hypothetical protein TVAG_251630 [Trichomonas vaginalis G3]KAI5507146.1 multidrug resistance protein YPNP-related family [Trichomonas vaginalis G3]|eukprot:XP_001320960.1 hypothetical protein [Trichomonas vaginalis G3]
MNGGITNSRRYKARWIIAVCYNNKTMSQSIIIATILWSSGLRSLVTPLSTFASGGTSINTGQLITKHEYEKAGKLFVEFIRDGLFIVILLPLLLILTAPMILTKIGMPENLKSQGSAYLTSIFIYTFFVYLFGFLNSILMSMGFVLISSIIQVLAHLLSLSFDALFIWGFHVQIVWMSVAFAAGPSTACNVTFILYIFNKFAVKPV